ncbi:MAG: DUF697 domain-containing protein [Merismopedia sp. SIO2A8]|nr:DUF697 domain-containing protein [Merismopedia sp. SIO2A8]
MIAKFQETLHSNNQIFQLLGKKPLLVTGLGLTAGISVWHVMGPSPSDVLGWLTWGAIAVGSGAWWLGRRSESFSPPSPSFPDTINRDAVDARLAEIKNKIEQFANDLTEAEVESSRYTGSIAHLHHQHDHLIASLDRTALTCTVIGAKGVGKTALTQKLIQLAQTTESASPYTLSFLDTPAVLTAPAATQSTPDTLGDRSIDLEPLPQQIDTLTKDVIDADIVTFVSEGDITASELQMIQSLLVHRHAVIVAFNKQDRYLPTERTEIFHRIQERLNILAEQNLVDQNLVENSRGENSLMKVAGVVMTSAIATPIKVRHHQADGTIQERMEELPEDVTSLSEHLQTMAVDIGETLVLTTTLRQAQHLQQSIQHHWNGVRRDRARPVIEQYQWIAAATAFANPLPSLDLLATGAINAQLLADLGAIYGQPFSIDQAKAATQTFAELMVKLGLVELTTQTITPLLKGHVLTYAAGGIVQGISAAYLTHIAGLSLVQYLEEQSLREQPESERIWNIDRLGQIMQHVFQHHRRGAFIQNLVNRGIQTLGDRLNPKTSPAVAS